MMICTYIHTYIHTYIYCILKTIAFHSFVLSRLLSSTNSPSISHSPMPPSLVIIINISYFISFLHTCIQI
ncbi:hypothetical protein Lalb_Chr14g0370891 [Lupinus albus]|uniref:Uncharacterized protein n=1 Tax=Lupinus albus TaxID=3870 RepID=A0A6A4PFI6_LUPAL|nr:hypothetical protein Lalb_Chr14g0370891 [Lupinus albus]